MCIEHIPDISQSCIPKVCCIVVLVITPHLCPRTLRSNAMSLSSWTRRGFCRVCYHDERHRVLELIVRAIARGFPHSTEHVSPRHALGVRFALPAHIKAATYVAVSRTTISFFQHRVQVLRPSISTHARYTAFFGPYVKSRCIYQPGAYSVESHALPATLLHE
jgi:hypothetical protein